LGCPFTLLSAIRRQNSSRFRKYFCYSGGLDTSIITFAGSINGPDPDEEVVAHCKMGGRSAKAYDAMKKAGFIKIKNLKGGILARADQVDRSLSKY